MPHTDPLLPASVHRCFLLLDPKRALFAPKNPRTARWFPAFFVEGEEIASAPQLAVPGTGREPGNHSRASHHACASIYLRLTPVLVPT